MKLTLRSDRNRLNLSKVEDASLKSFQVEFRAQSEVVKRDRILKEFEFDIYCS